jgi:FAD:protein FMN transferase
MKKYLILLLLPVFGYSQIPIKIEGEAQGTTYHITYYDKKNRDLKPEIEKILQDYDRSVSTYKSNSIITRINKNDKSVKADAYFKACFKTAKKIYKKTNGCFDPTVYPLVNAWGFGPEKKIKVEKQKIDSILQFVGFDLIELKGNKIIKKDDRVQLDFNAFAQGYSVDVVSNFLKSKNIKSFVVEIGGEVYANNLKPDNTFWTVGIEKPVDNKESENPFEAFVKLKNLAIATSGNYRKYFIENGVKYAHHIDPKTGYPTKNNLLSASVFSRNCIVSDATATGLLVMGLDKAKVYLDNNKDIFGYLIYSDENGNYQVYESEELKAILTLNK